ncbi:unnamed protein product [Spodoptera littoralis]|uniref:Breast cancer type 1 susceptibility protein n=1 Tax=Spodoptera littoralis TaxID=7109 RepID=A0A9P0IG26_SPOLI|nr:unnamed protein product [Spodoptera littoralis]CAH1646619.1 unnamed protein product [Spodoptera littoralis]
MNLKALDVAKLSKLTSLQIDHVTCLECCKYYIAPATAACGHTLCHTCWRGRRTCPACAKQLERKALKLNIPLQKLTEHIQMLGEAFEKLFNVKLDEFNLDTPGELDSEKDPDKNVKDWLTSSQNHFSAPVQNSEVFSQDLPQPSNPLEVSASNILIHTDTRKTVSPPKVVHVPPPQDDWDKIEPMPEPTNTKKSENIIGPMDIEPFFVEDTEYTTDNPRRSSRKRDLKDESAPKDLSSNMHSSRDSSADNDKKSQKSKQNWNNVKRMRKEFSKLNKKNRNKLNVSIEMVKKTQNPKPVVKTPITTQQVYNIDDNTPEFHNKENEDVNINQNELVTEMIDPEVNLTEKEYRKNCDSVKPVVQETEDIPSVISEEDKASNYINKESCTSKHIEKSTEVQKRIPVPQLKMPFIKKGALNPQKTEKTILKTNEDTIQPISSDNSDDIEISIKIGNTITNIVIKKKEKDVQVKINTDREIQTSLGPDHLAKTTNSVPKSTNTQNIDISITNNNTDGQKPLIKIQESSGKEQTVGLNEINKIPVVDNTLDKTTSLKKNTASADTATAQFEITESVEKELSKIMECEDSDHEEIKSVKRQQSEQPHKIIEPSENIDDFNDLDIFHSGSVKEAQVQPLKEHAPSEILGSTVCSKFRTQKLAEKRIRDINDGDVLPNNKKIKITPGDKNKKVENQPQPDSEPINYDAIMGQVFASIDADMEDIRKSQEVVSGSILKDKVNSQLNIVAEQNKKNLTQIKNTQTSKKVLTQINAEITPNLKEYFNEKHSENVFSIVEKDYEEITKLDKVPQQVEELLTPVLCQNLNSTQESQDCIMKTNKTNIRSQDYDDSDRSVVEETPQKNLSFSKLKRASTSNQSQIALNENKKVSITKSTPSVKSIINLTDTVTESNRSSRDLTVIEVAAPKQALETPLTITKFADQIKHKSTPMARKSLNFDHENDDNDPEQTLCQTSEIIAKTTQEREFMSKAFESTPTTPAARPLVARNLASNANKKYCLAGSCLTATQITKLKILCNERKWSYVDKYTNDITHLIVGVDDEKKSQRSVKYMCALAASKWIVSFDWINKIMQTKEIVNEEYYEALDSTGEPGPRRSRIAKQKLFDGITFYCMPPFGVLDVETLKNMLMASGGRVVADMKHVRISEGSLQPALLLAEPESTQEDRFIFLAMEQSIVPVNYEWVLNCLGGYSLISVQEHLLCPSSLLPAATAKWPEVLFSQDD